MKYKKTNTHLPSPPDNASKPSLSLEHNAPHINHFREFFFFTTDASKGSNCSEGDHGEDDGHAIHQA